MLRTSSEVGEIIGSHRVGRITIAQIGAPLQNEVDFFFMVVMNGLAMTAAIERNLGEPRHGVQGIL